MIEEGRSMQMRHLRCLEDRQDLKARICKAFATPVQEFEDSHPLSGKSGADEGCGAARRDAIGRLVSLGRSLGLHEECIHDSAQLLDRLSRMGLSSDTLAPPVLGAIALISAKQGRATDSRLSWKPHETSCMPFFHSLPPPVGDRAFQRAPSSGSRRHHRIERCMQRGGRVQPQSLPPALSTVPAGTKPVLAPCRRARRANR